MLALVHDVLVVLGVFSILQKQVDSSFVAALLTIVGYSINDTIVIFDRIRENNRLMQGATCEEVAEKSIRQTMRRSVFTSLTTLFTIVILYILSVPSIREFSFPIIVGIIAGFYSSVFISGNVWILLKNKFSKKKN